jgi:drug/metabolite transporter (DMT)-like permease
MHPSIPYFSVFVLIGLTIFGDYYIKISADMQSLFSWQFSAGLAIYSLGAFGWYFAMRFLPLTSISVLYSSLTVVTMVILGVAVFKEDFGLKQALGMALAVAAVLVIVDWKQILNQ